MKFWNCSSRKLKFSLKISPKWVAKLKYFQISYWEVQLDYPTRLLLKILNFAQNMFSAQQLMHLIQAGSDLTSKHSICFVSPSTSSYYLMLGETVQFEKISTLFFENRVYWLLHLFSCLLPAQFFWVMFSRHPFHKSSQQRPLSFELSVFFVFKFVVLTLLVFLFHSFGI